MKLKPLPVLVMLLPCLLSSLCDLGPSQAILSLRLLLFAMAVFAVAALVSSAVEMPTARAGMSRMVSAAIPLLAAASCHRDLSEALGQRPQMYAVAGATALLVAAIAIRNKRRMVVL